MSFEKIINSLTESELAVFKLRALYNEFGYAQYKMSKFEEYDFYMENKDYLVSEGIITFTDEGGKLLALKPDVTLSIIKAHKHLCGVVNKLCYNENVYRAEKRSGAFKEIMQVGLECLGDVMGESIAEVIFLAAKSLEIFSKNYALEISDLDIVSELIKIFGLSENGASELVHYLSQKNEGGIKALLAREGVGKEGEELFLKLCSIYGKPEQVIAELADFKITDELSLTVDRFSAMLMALSALGLGDVLFVDFSAVGNMKYYNGIIFRGYIDGVPKSVLSGGQYDNLLTRMKKSSRGLGFAVYLDALEGV